MTFNLFLEFDIKIIQLLIIIKYLVSLVAVYPELYFIRMEKTTNVTDWLCIESQ